MSTEIRIGRTGLTEAVRRINEYREKVRAEQEWKRRRQFAEDVVEDIYAEMAREENGDDDDV